jgi:hypothetical protein
MVIAPDVGEQDAQQSRAYQQRPKRKAEIMAAPLLHRLSGYGLLIHAEILSGDQACCPYWYYRCWDFGLVASVSGSDVFCPK